MWGLIFGLILIAWSIFKLAVNREDPSGTVFVYSFLIIIAMYIMSGSFRNMKRKETKNTSEEIDTDLIDSTKIQSFENDSYNYIISNPLYVLSVVFRWLGHATVMITILGILVLMFYIETGGASGVPIAYGIIATVLFYSIGLIFWGCAKK